MKTKSTDKLEAPKASPALTGYAQIAISGKKLAIFGSRMGFLGPVLQDYTPFEKEADAIKDARLRMSAIGIQCDEEICRPNITRMTYSERKVRVRND